MLANQVVWAGGYQRNQTVITFDNGARWQKVAAPANPSDCTLVR